MNRKNESLFFVGSYSTPGPYFEANGRGLYSLALDRQTGEIRQLAVAGDVSNATYLAKRPGDTTLYVASDCYFEPGEILACRVDARSGTLEKQTTQSVRGASVCHIELNRDATEAYVCAYLDGCLSVYDVDGPKVASCKKRIAYPWTGERAGANTERQETAHAHQSVVAPDGRHLYVVDLGNDRIWIHDLRDLTTEPEHTSLPAGHGPRHLVCHPDLPLVYVFFELSAKVFTCRRDPATGQLHVLDEAKTLPDDFEGVPSGAAIRLHPSLKTLYVSNRNSNSIAVLELDSDGLPHEIGNFPSGGEEPRDFTFDPSGAWLVVANQNSDNISTFSLHPETGRPDSASPKCTYACGSPVAVLFF